jgi:hypothetical protein
MMGVRGGEKMNRWDTKDSLGSENTVLYGSDRHISYICTIHTMYNIKSEL